ncbi:diheme cytochrome c precursor [Persicimonas caeni]|uniref:Diheme cytochrome c n=1 Tax=Persicimonas caeni TaxID=2292766 RepID=A0A4Y6PPE3_PERCE|nr:diheme cytochrome c precursor [Persicimonas caeni]QDG50184.1 diheme cytochrome c precursor [Persicimonas caeni]QED31405.1 diheme cytochrome c precursor [Persicimonas caeni]
MSTPNETPEPTGEPSASHKPIQLFLVVAIAVAFIGFFVGTRSSEYDPNDPTAVERAPGEAKPARTYTQILDDPLESNEHWEDSIAELAKERPDLYAEVKNSPEKLEQALRERAQNRAFAGAPPTVPHPVKQTGDLACASCHTDGLKVRGRTASPMSHEFLTNCTQCHVPSTSPGPNDPSITGTMTKENTFAGLQEPRGGDVAWEGAPPQTPHSTWMRSDCTSCHGPMSKEGMKSTHPWRQNCQQCHAPSSQLNQEMPPAMLDQPMPLARPQ